jgi:hypothetical protein
MMGQLDATINAARGSLIPGSGSAVRHEYIPVRLGGRIPAANGLSNRTRQQACWALVLKHAVNTSLLACRAPSLRATVSATERGNRPAQ